MNWDQVAEIASGIFVLAGSTLCFFGGLGLLRFPDMLSRLHAATKPQILGMILIFVGVAIYLRSPSSVGVLLLIALFQIMTAPVAGHMLARAAYRTGQIKSESIVLDELAEHYAQQQPTTREGRIS